MSISSWGFDPQRPLIFSVGAAICHCVPDGQNARWLFES